METIELTRTEARHFKNGHGMAAFAFARKLKRRAGTKANETGKPCTLSFEGEVLYTAEPIKCEVCGGAHPEEKHERA